LNFASLLPRSVNYGRDGETCHTRFWSGKKGMPGNDGKGVILRYYITITPIN